MLLKISYILYIKQSQVNKYFVHSHFNLGIYMFMLLCYTLITLEIPLSLNDKL